MPNAVMLDSPVQFKPGTRELRGDPRHEPKLWYPGQTHIWRMGFFTVPDEETEEQVQAAAPRYRKRHAEYLESKEGGGYTVLGFDGPHEDKTMVGRGMTPPGRRRYVLWTKIRRRPKTIKVDVPDDMVEQFKKQGYKLV